MFTDNSEGNPIIAFSLPFAEKAQLMVTVMRTLSSAPAIVNNVCVQKFRTHANEHTTMGNSVFPPQPLTAQSTGKLQLTPLR